MAANRKVDYTSTFLLAAMMAILWKCYHFSIGIHDGYRVAVLSTFLLAAMMVIMWKCNQLFYWPP
jgi:hypothetical protein